MNADEMRIAIGVACIAAGAGLGVAVATAAIELTAQNRAQRKLKEAFAESLNLANDSTRKYVDRFVNLEFEKIIKQGF